ncbi:unnamed protein product [Rotaria socialis]|uniref:N-acetyltransferase domain-containing protein n=1 Tax=Rotaria socialis TaxID=392032 RepID=A0A817RJJ0_9BILA|nr:unnamed protein product [Rotaria socialis]CAF3413584.1 unnamed protein product [Rotaria socialis]CAF3418148.1 unnamed protein product [Rotaria socialis]CAF4272868.1 unnamed protein product [Rotaria socialis]CAF4293636.1 unnamed protein product [Rotaria socialis]
MSSSTPSALIQSDTEEPLKSLLSYRTATLADCEAVSTLVNSGYRGESSRQGWTTEEALVGGLRTHPSKLIDIINDKINVILLFFEESENVLVGCVHLRHEPVERSASLGMLTVRPDLQGRGYGKFILSIAENYVRDTWDVAFVKMAAIMQRPELVAYYNRRGYIDTGRREPFPKGDERSGIPKVQDLEFCILKKCVKFSQ